MTNKQSDVMKRFISRIENDGTEKFITYYPESTNGLIWIVETTAALYRIELSEKTYYIYGMRAK